MKKRNPIAVVLGHVDHGKTTLLDAIRKTNVASREAGGITQSIGASVVNGITFIDTPGHAAFSKMRSRGGSVADIAVLVVACDDGVAPQTKEALKIIKDAGIPYVVAAAKIDIAGVDPEVVRSELEKEKVTFEGKGGETPFVPVSAKNGQGIPELLETILLVSEVKEIKGDSGASLEAVVIESFKDKRGLVVNLIIRNGTLKVASDVTIADFSGRVRALFNDKGESVKESFPGEPVQVIGLEQSNSVVPKKVLGDARRLAEDELPIIIKASNAGALEAVISSLPSKVVVVDEGIGEVTSSDVITAKTGNARIFAFESRLPNDVLKLAEAEGVKCERFEIIYELIQRLEEILKGGKVEILGKANILATFPFNNKKVAGCKVTEGKISKGDKLILVRDEKEIGKAKATSIKKQKTEVAQVGQGEEFGVILDPQLDFLAGDVLVSSR
ncbi:MAG: Translation initiation factor IF-2 [Candidatus Woesebacteria bacterium GW2011_GWB1_41_10]|uniref:Translation initiation factor IF-2 n=1 Tax=Candidatus Woesebacteria bacterium GW2011_GWB1_41_10 TaxID=1618577 RepID=A0A0G0UBX1_9BACT|nr:MAG: Translation initiation factor IF-2 [Candidatus Woesebacteria bacterium GW2011_GWB1_41_10]